MSDAALEALKARVAQEPYPGLLDIETLEVRPGYARTAMTFTPRMANIFGMLHGGAVFSLLDEAFQLACNAYGSVAVALEVSVYYFAPARPGARLICTCSEVHATRKTALYDCLVVEEADERRIAGAQALAYRKGTPHPFTAQGELISQE